MSRKRIGAGGRRAVRRVWEGKSVEDYYQFGVT